MLFKRFFLIIFLLLLSPVIASAGAIGTVAPGFTLNDAAGREVSLGDFAGKVVFVNFWASWCAPCKKELPELASFIAGYDPGRAVVLAVNIDKVHSHAEDFLRVSGPVPSNMHVLFDPEASVVSRYKAAAMPTSFIIDGSGRIRFIHFGFKEDSPREWASELDDLLAKTGPGGKP